MEKTEAIVLNNLNDNAQLRIQSIINDNGDMMSLIYEALNYANGECGGILNEVISILDRQIETIKQIKQYHELTREKIKEYEEKE